MNIDEYDKRFIHFCKVNNAPITWLRGATASSKAYSYFGEQWEDTFALANDFVNFRRD